MIFGMQIYLYKDEKGTLYSAQVFQVYLNTAAYRAEL
jgi:hypothetical protein